MRHELLTFLDDDSLADAAASFVAERARRAVAAKGSFTFATSGGRTPWAMFERLASQQIPWEQVVLYQVDERVVALGDDHRNLSKLESSLGTVRPTIVAMPVDEDDLDAAAERYASLLPERFDLVHLGIGPDGHTASLVPGDPVLDVQDRLVAVTGLYDGLRRMTLTYPALARADQLLWLVTHAEDRTPLRLLLDGDTSIPAGQVQAENSLIMASRVAVFP